MTILTLYAKFMPLPLHGDDPELTPGPLSGGIPTFELLVAGFHAFEPINPGQNHCHRGEHVGRNFISHIEPTEQGEQLWVLCDVHALAARLLNDHLRQLVSPLGAHLRGLVQSIFKGQGFKGGFHGIDVIDLRTQTRTESSYALASTTRPRAAGERCSCSTGLAALKI